MVSERVFANIDVEIAKQKTTIGQAEASLASAESALQNFMLGFQKEYVGKEIAELISEISKAESSAPSTEGPDVSEKDELDIFGTGENSNKVDEAELLKMKQMVETYNALSREKNEALKLVEEAKEYQEFLIQQKALRDNKSEQKPDDKKDKAPDDANPQGGPVIGVLEPIPDKELERKLTSIREALGTDYRMETEPDGQHSFVNNKDTPNIFRVTTNLIEAKGGKLNEESCRKMLVAASVTFGQDLILYSPKKEERDLMVKMSEELGVKYVVANTKAEFDDLMQKAEAKRQLQVEPQNPQPERREPPTTTPERPLQTDTGPSVENDDQNNRRGYSVH